MRSSLAIQHELNQVIKAQKQFALTISNQIASSESVNEAIHSTDAQSAEMAHILLDVADTQRLDAPRNPGTSLHDQEPNETERNRLFVAEETDALQELVSLGPTIDKQEVCRRIPAVETVFDKGEDEMREPQGLLDERKAEHAHGGRYPVLGQVAELGLEIEGSIERTSICGLAEQSSSRRLTEQEKEANLETVNEAVSPIRSKKTARVKKSKKKSDGPTSATPLKGKFAGMNSASHASPTQVHSSPSIFPPAPYHQHGPTTFPYALPSTYNLSQYPAYPPSGAGMMYQSFYGPPSYSQSHFAPPGTTVTHVNSGNVTNVTISNVNNDNYGKGMAILFAHREYSHRVLLCLIVARPKGK